jgi:ABC-type glycerol-3-phosphate transport system permease component
LTLVVVYAAFNLPFAVWMMVSFIQQIPYELEESGEVDGATRLRILWHVVLPLAASGLAATTILVSLIAWNEFLIPLVLAGNQTRTLPLLISTFVQARTLDWGVMTAGATIAILPIAILTVLAQRSLVSGLGIGAVKQ